MATHILGRNHTVLIPDSANTRQHIKDADIEAQEHEGSAARGFFYAMMFNVLLVLAGLAVWQVWLALR